MYKRIAILGTRTRGMVIGQLHRNELRHRSAFGKKQLGEISFKLLHSKLIGNVHIVPGIIPRGTTKYGLGHGEGDGLCRTQNSIVPFFANRGILIGLSEVEK